MNPTLLSAYVQLRRSTFDIKSDMGPVHGVKHETDLLRAASVMGRIDGLTPLDGGTFNMLFRFETGDGPFVLRLPSSPELDAGLLVEDWAAKAANEVHFGALEATVTDTSHYLVPFSYQILPYIKGPSEPMTAGRFERLANIHLAGFGPLDPRPLLINRRPSGLFDTWESYLVTKLDEHLDYCVAIEAMTATEAEEADDLIRGLKTEFDTCLIHNDLSPRNTIADLVIDWESCIAGDPVWEMAGYAAFRADKAFTEYAWFKEHVGSNYADFDRRFWTYFLRISLARTVHRHRFAKPENPAFPKASRRIQIALDRLS